MSQKQTQSPQIENHVKILKYTHELFFSFYFRIVANYVIWRFIRNRINNLDKRFQKAQQELYRSLYGREETPQRWKICVEYGNGILGNSVGALFVKKYFDEQSKADVSYDQNLNHSSMLQKL